MKTDLSPDTDISLLPRADLPVIWDAFRAKAEAVRAIAETLVVTDISQKEAMALARTTRLTLREIRIAVENKRVELGESHQKEIKKVNGAATAIKEFIQPLEARLLVQEEFGERAEAARIAELSKSRTAELLDLRRNFLFSGNIGALSQEEYDILLANLRNEQAEIEAANRLRIEAERRLAESQAEARRVEQSLRAEAAALLLAQQVEAKAEQDRQNAIAEAKALEVYADVKRKNEAEHAIQVIEALQQKRIRDEQAEKVAKLEAQLAAAEQEKAAIALDAAHKVAVEEARLRRIAVAPDIEKMRDYASTLRGVIIPNVGSSPAQAVVREMVSLVSRASALVENFCCDEGLTGE